MIVRCLEERAMSSSTITISTELGVHGEENMKSDGRAFVVCVTLLVLFRGCHHQGIIT